MRTAPGGPHLCPGPRIPVRVLSPGQAPVRGGWCGPPRLTLGSLSLRLPGSRLRMVGVGLPWLSSGGRPTHGRGVQSQGQLPGHWFRGPCCRDSRVRCRGRVILPRKAGRRDPESWSWQGLVDSRLRPGDPRALALDEWVWSPDPSPNPVCSALWPAGSPRLSCPGEGWSSAPPAVYAPS